jgi:hypothetical protein
MRTARWCSIVAAILAVAAAVAALADPGVYRDNDFVRAAWKGSDVTTLGVAVPALIGGLALSRRSDAAMLIWLGVLDYLLYAYAYYLFGAQFNDWFLAYVAIVAASGVAIVFALIAIDAHRISRTVLPRRSDRWVAGYMIFVAAGLTLVYTLQSIAFIRSGTLPAIVTSTQHPTSVVFALDLTLLVPPLVIAATWLWHHRPWGYVLAALLNVKGAIYTLSLIISSLSAVQAGYGAAGNEVPLWIFLTIGNAVSALTLLARAPAAAAA